MGPAAVLESIPLNITGVEKDYEFTTSWILPVLRENSPCIFYRVLPLAASCLGGRKRPRPWAITLVTRRMRCWSIRSGCYRICASAIRLPARNFLPVLCLSSPAEMSRVIVRQLVEKETFEKLVSGKKRKRGASEAGSQISLAHNG